MSERSERTINEPGNGGPRKRRGLDGRVIGGRYRVTRTVAAGANTLIADAVDLELDRAVTIKLVRPELSESEEFRRRVRTQMEAVAAVSHPNLAAIYDWGEERIGKRTTVYVASELLTGGSLRDMFDRKRTLSPSQALMVGLEACRGLDFAHRKGLVHSELTPSKLVFGDDRRLRIVDFGLAHILGEQLWSDPSQLPTHVARYASPEQALAAQGEPVEIDGRTDVYSLALILTQAVTGTLPFQGDSTVATLSARIGKLMPVSADLGPLAAVLERAGRPEPSERATASQFGRDLVRAAERMPRPQPIPILAPALFDDPAVLRRPNDPTGGIARPPAEPEPALVPPAPEPPEGDAEIDVADEVPAGVAADVAAEVDAAPDVDVDVEASEPEHDDGGVHDDAADEVDRIETGEVPAEVPAAPPAPYEGDGFGDLAELVERTPPPPPPDEPAETAVRGRAARRQRKEERRQQGETVAEPPAPGRPRHRILSSLFGLVLVAVLAGLGLVAWKLFRTPTHVIPDVAGLSQDDALDLVDDFKWDVEIQPTRDDEFETPGEAVRTSPPAGESLAEGSPLLLLVSEGPEYRQIPELAGSTVDEATAALAAARLVVGSVTYAYDPTAPEGAVVGYGIDGPLPEQGVLPGVAVNLVVSQGPAPIAVPNVVGRTPEQAQRLLEQFGLTLTVGEPVFSNDVAAGLIATQDPAADAEIVPGNAITVSPSKGPDLVTMPDLTGLTVPQIRETLTANGLVPGYLLGSTQGVFVKATINGAEVAAGTAVLRGSTVDFFAFPPG